MACEGFDEANRANLRRTERTERLRDAIPRVNPGHCNEIVSGGVLRKRVSKTSRFRYDRQKTNEQQEVSSNMMRMVWVTRTSRFTKPLQTHHVIWSTKYLQEDFLAFVREQAQRWSRLHTRREEVSAEIHPS